MTTDKALYNAYRFFRDHAGYVVGERGKGALALAKAERWAEENGIEFIWEWDTDGDLGDHEAWCGTAREDAWRYGYGRTCTHDVEWCRAEYNDETVASLGGIIDADRNYRRVVEAELAREAQEEAEKYVYY